MANNPAVIRDKFEQILKEGKNILHIAFSSALSGSYNNIVMTVQELLEDYPDRRILVFDSLNASLGEGVSVYRAVELWKEGKTMEEVYDILMEERIISTSPSQSTTCIICNAADGYPGPPLLWEVWSISNRFYL